MNSILVIYIKIIKNLPLMEPNIEYLNCPAHPKQFIQLICLSCNSSSLACPLCLDITHNMHEVISLKKFMSQEVPKLYHQKPNKDAYLKHIDQLGDTIKQQIEKMRKQIGHQINQLQIFYADHQQRLKSEVKFICGELDKKYLYQNAQATKQKLNKKITISDQSNLGAKVLQIQKKVSQNINDACLQIRRIIYRLKYMYTESAGILLNSKSLSNFQFAQNLCHPSIEIKENKLTAINKHFDNLYHTCAISPPLNPFRNQITLQVKKSQHKCVWIGVSALEGLKSLKFQNSYKSEHPNYWIWQAGGDDEAELYAQGNQARPLIGWNFDAGEKITLKIQYRQNDKKMLSFTKNKYTKQQSQQKQQYSVDLSSGIGLYYACVSLGDELESVAIVDQ